MRVNTRTRSTRRDRVASRGGLADISNDFRTITFAIDGLNGPAMVVRTANLTFKASMTKFSTSKRLLNREQ